MDLSILSVFLVSLVSVALGIFFGLFINKIINKKNIQAAKEAANQYIRRSESRSKEILIEAKEEAHNITLKTEKKLNRIQLDLDRTESRLETRENSINDLEVNLKNKNIELNKLVKKSEKNQEEIEISKKEIKQKLENITGLSVKEGHRIVEIGCIELDDLIPTKKIFHCYLNPGRKVSEKALEVHGYTDEFLSILFLPTIESSLFR